MHEVNRLGVRVAGLTAALLLLLFGLYWGARFLLRERAPAAREPTSLADRQRDSDADGVADLYETAYYATNPNGRDTDGDGMSDLDEILAGRDPTQSGPDDADKPPTGEAVAVQDTFTKQYLASLPADVSREQILDQERLAAFVEARKGTLLSAVPREDLTVTQASGREAVRVYLDAISSAHNERLRAVTSADIETAFRLQVNAQNTEPMETVLASLEGNLTALRAVPVPAEASELHRTLLAATAALLENTRMLRTIDADFVGGLIAAKRIEELGGVFQETAADVAALEKQYGLE